MLRWMILRHHARTLRRPCLPYPSRQAPCTYLAATRVGGSRWSTTTTKPQAERTASAALGERLEPAGLRTLEPHLRVDAWLALLEPALPKHLRSDDAASGGPVLSPAEIFQVLSGAQIQASAIYATDVLSYLAQEKGRWSLVVWLVKHLMEAFATSSPSSDVSTVLVCLWRNDLPLSELTRSPVDLQHTNFLQDMRSTDGPTGSLDEGTAGRVQSALSSDRNLRHNVLGMIWRGLGNMTIACAGGEIRPEILEIIAHLHHQGYMPSSIYDSKPTSDPTAIQQSPILNLLSSRILTSLSDAAWRAHERLIVEQAEDQGSDYAALRPEIRGRAYRVRVTGLKPEVWLELILWSCLHGGWIDEGIKILQRLCNKQRDEQWRPLSWRSLVSDQPKDTRDWETVEYLFNNWAASSMDLDEPVTPISVQRTVSSEIVNAYIDASISATRLSARETGRSVSQTIKFATAMQQFLGRSGLSLGAGSWDAIVLRLFDSQDTSIYQPTNFDKVIRLSPPMGQEIKATNTRGLPDYVFDGTAAVLGLFHRALYHRIKEADVEGALRLFASLQERADENKRQSVVDFLRKGQVFADASEPSNQGQFTANYNGSIDYPAFYVQIPPNILGPFMELVADAKAYDFGKWLLYSDEIDGPIIPPKLYGHPSITPALVRFAAETGDKHLLSRLIKIRTTTAEDGAHALPRRVLQSFLESQINLQRWDAAVKILRYMRDSHGSECDVVTLSHLIRMSLFQAKKSSDGDQQATDNLRRARALFQHLVRGGYDKPEKRRDFVRERIDNLLIIVASIGYEWTGFSVNTQPVNGYRVFNLPAKAFNLILDGVVDSYGSAAGRKLIGIFWSHQVRAAQGRESLSERRATDAPFSSFGRTLPEYIRRQRTEVRLPGRAERKIVVYGGLRPDMMTIRIVLKKAIEELINQPAKLAADAALSFADSPAELAEADMDELNDKADPAIDTSAAGMVVWAVRCLKRLGMTVEDVKAELRDSLSSSKLDLLLEKSPDLLTPLDSQGQGNAGDESDLDAKNTEQRQSQFVPMRALEG